VGTQPAIAPFPAERAYCVAAKRVYWMPLFGERRDQTSVRHEELAEDKDESKQPGQHRKPNEP